MNRLFVTQPDGPAVCRRRSMRWPVEMPLWHGPENALLQASSAVDLCEEGIAFRTERDYAIGSKVFIELEYHEAGSSARRIGAIVRHSQRGVTGVEFVDLPRTEKQRILEIIYLAIAVRRR